VINRVTQQTIQRTTLTNLQRNLSSMSNLQAQLSSTKRIQRPSDDPAGVGSSMSMRADRAAATQALRNANDGSMWLGQIDTAVQGSISALRRVRDLTVQGANTGSMGQTSRDAIATELDGLRDTLLDLANTNINGRNVFAGTTADGIAFDDASTGTPYAWHGTAGASVERRLGPDATVRVDADGDAIFGSGAASVFKLVDDIAADLRAGVNVTGRLSALDDRLNGMLSGVADVGIRYKQLTDAQSSLQFTVQNFSSSISGIEDIDLAETVLELQMQEVAYQGALGATARVLQPTLMDFLR